MKIKNLIFELEKEVFYIQEGKLFSEKKKSSLLPSLKKLWNNSLENYSVSFGSPELYFFKTEIKPLGGVLNDFTLQEVPSDII